MEKVFIKWSNYVTQLEQMVEATQNANLELSSAEVVVGLTRGGLMPAVFISHALNIPMITFDPHVLHSTGVEREPVSLPISPVTVKNIMIVDDISDTGKTFTKCTKFFENRGFKCTTMSVFINRTTTTFVPDYPGINSEKKWVVFPYEVD